MKLLASLWWARVVITLVVLFVTAAALAILQVSPIGTDLLFLAVSVGLLLTIEFLRGNVATSGLTWHANSLRLLIYGLTTTVCMIAIVVVVALGLGGRFIVPEQVQPSLMGLIALFAVRAVIEEVVFRGTIFEAVHERFGAATAVLGTGLLFGVAHIANPDSNILSVVNTTCAGILLGILVAQSHSLYAAIAFHVSWNVLVGLIVGNVSGTDLGIGVVSLDTSSTLAPWLFGYAYGIEEGALTTGLLVLAALVALKTVPLDAETRAARYRRSFSLNINSAT